MDDVFKKMSLRFQWEEGRDVFLRDGKAAHGFLKKLNGEGEHLLAVEVGEEILSGGALVDDVPVRQQVARALAILGSSDEARRVLEGISGGRKDEGETLGLLARVWKDLAVRASEPGEVKRCYGEARACYGRGYEAAVAAGDEGGAAYCGVNAAAMSVMLGEMDVARDYAGKAAVHAGGDGSYYGTATRAEAALILGNDEEAEAMYRAASELGEKGRQWADLASTRKQCRALCHVLHGRRDRFDGCFVSGVVAIFSGQVFAKDEELSDEVRNDVEARVARWIEENEIRHVYVGASLGWDLILGEVAKRAGMEVHLILPYEKDLFVRNEFQDGERFELLCGGAASVTALGREPIREKAGERMFVDKMVAARGSLLASHLGVGLKALAVGDVKSATAVGLWSDANLDAFVIYPKQPELDGVPEKDVVANPLPFPQALGGVGNRQAVLAILHVHFQGYEEMGSEGYLVFREKVLETMAGCVVGLNRPATSVLGLGGEYSFAFAGVYGAAEAALRLSEALGKVLEGEMKMPAMCLHAGPVGLEVNPLLHIYAPSGETVTRCGVICGSLPSGSISATETFVALSVLEAVRGFRFEHTGKIECNGRADRLFRLQTNLT